MPHIHNQEQVEYRPKWGDAADLPLLVGDLIHWRTTADRCIVTVGQMDLPLIDGPILPGTEIPIRPVARLLLTPDTIGLWAEILSEAAAQFKGPQATK